MPEVTLSLRQEAEVLTDLSRGRSMSQTASRRHLPVAVVEAIASQHDGGIAGWTKASRDLNRRLRQDDLEDVEAPPIPAAVNGHADPGVVGGPAIRSFGRCSWTGCDHDYLMDSKTPLVEVQAAMDEHGATHRTPAADPPKDAPDAAATVMIEIPRLAEPAKTEVEELAPVGLDVEAGGDVEEVAPDGPETATVPLAVSPDSMEFLLETAEAIGGEAITTITARIRELADKLRGLIDEHQATNRRRVEILAELGEIETREQALWAELLELGYPASGMTPATTPPALPASLAAGVWWQLAKEVRARIKPWAAANDVPHGKTGRQPDATVEAYLAAHPEDDPR